MWPKVLKDIECSPASNSGSGCTSGAPEGQTAALAHADEDLLFLDRCSGVGRRWKLHAQAYAVTPENSHHGAIVHGQGVDKLADAGMVRACDACALGEDPHGLVGEIAVGWPFNNLDFGPHVSFAISIRRTVARNPRLAPRRHVNAAPFIAIETKRRRGCHDRKEGHCREI